MLKVSVNLSVNFIPGVYTLWDFLWFEHIGFVQEHVTKHYMGPSREQSNTDTSLDHLTKYSKSGNRLHALNAKPLEKWKGSSFEVALELQ